MNRNIKGRPMGRPLMLRGFSELRGLVGIPLLAFLLAPASSALSQTTRPAEVWMGPPGFDNGRCLRQLFEQPDAWKQARSRIDVLCYTDLNFNKQFSDAELTSWFAMLHSWHVRLGLEVGSVKPWSPKGAKTFSIEKPMWDRIQRLGGAIDAIAMDEPLLCSRRDLKQSDEEAIRQVADYIARVREHFPRIRIGDIEPYPSIPLADHLQWIAALKKELAGRKVAGLDFYRLDVNWAEFVVFDRGNWPEVKKLERSCRQQKLGFSLIYWASGYPGLEKKGLADDSTWYTSIMQQGYDYALVGGAPDQYVIESWLKDAPSRMVPESDPFTFTRSVRDFAGKFAGKP